MQIEQWPIDKLTANPRNSRTHSPEQVEQLKASLTEFGWTMPVLADEGGLLIAGHGRTMAAKALGMSEVPVIVARGWSDAQKRAYLIADNKLTENGGWDDEMLKIEFEELRDLGVDLSLTGFGQDEIAGLLDVRLIGGTDPDDAGDPPADPVTVLGDVWVMGRHRLVCGDSTSKADVERVLDGAKPHLMVTDPPYGVEYDPAWREEAARKGLIGFSPSALGVVQNDERVDWTAAWSLFPGDVAYVWHADVHAAAVQASIEAVKFDIRCQIILAKSSFAISRGHYNWQHEPCWYAVRKGKTASWNGDSSASTLWQIAHNKNDSGHGTQKPVECMRKPMENNSKPGDAVYDPFVGSGTSIIAAEMSGRRCYSVELSPAYVDVAVKRWQEFSGETAVLEGAGEAFDDVAARRKKR